MSEHDQRSVHSTRTKQSAHPVHLFDDSATRTGISRPTARTGSLKNEQDVQEEEKTNDVGVVNPCVRGEVEADLLAMCRQAPQSWSGMTLENLCSALIKQERAVEIIYERLVSPDGVVQEIFSRDDALDPSVRLEVSRRRKKSGAWVDAGFHAFGGLFGAVGGTGGRKEDIAPEERKTGTVAQQEAQKAADAIRQNESKGAKLPVSGVTRPEQRADAMPKVKKEKVDEVEEQEVQDGGLFEDLFGGFKVKVDEGVEQEKVQDGGLFEDLFGGLADVLGFGGDDDEKPRKLTKKEREKLAERKLAKYDAKERKKQKKDKKIEAARKADEKREAAHVEQLEADEHAIQALTPEQGKFKIGKDGKPILGKDGKPANR